jgi:hypothetical protein
MYETLNSTYFIGVSENALTKAWDILAKACTVTAKANKSTCDAESGILIREVLLSSAEHCRPEFNEESNNNFDKTPAWGTPAPRIQAAEGIMILSRFPSCMNERLAAIIKILSSDSVNAVRYQVASYLCNLYNSAPSLMWEVVERMCREDKSAGVLDALVTNTLYKLSSVHPDKIFNLLKLLFSRIPMDESTTVGSLRENAATILFWLYIAKDHKQSKDELILIVSSLLSRSKEVHAIITQSRSYIMNDDETRRLKVFELINQISKNVSEAIQNILKSRVGSSPLKEEDTEIIKTLGIMADSIAMQIYFGSGAYDANAAKRKGDQTSYDEIKLKQLLNDVLPIYTNLCEMPFPHMIHSICETIEYLVDADPINAFMTLAKVVNAGKRGSYQYESLAADLIVRIVENYLSEYRYIFREREDCRKALVGILDSFVEAGWPSARGLVYRLEDIYR